MADYEKELFSNEKLLCQVNRHRIIAVLPALSGGLLLVSGLLLGKWCLQINDDDEKCATVLLLALCFLVSVLLFVLAARLRARPQLAITNLRVIIFIGVIYERTLTMLITAIEDVHIKQGELGKMLGYSNITIQSRNYPTLLLLYIQGGDQSRRKVLLQRYELGHTVGIPQGSFGMMRLTP
jgi:hypothetical protein